MTGTLTSRQRSAPSQADGASAAGENRAPADGDPTHFAARLAGVRERIARAAVAAGRDPSSVGLLAVSKGFPASAVRAAYACGVRDFGENYVQEWSEKAAALADLKDLRWHFIGHLQSNKVRPLVPLIHSVHSVDRPSIVELLSRRIELSSPGRAPVRVYVEMVVAADDPNKQGCTVKEAEALCARLREFPHIDWVGFMGMGPAGKPDAELAPLFATFVAEARRLWQAHAPESRRAQGPELSLGMSGDLETAIAAGSTLVRVGTALFGERAPAQAPVRPLPST